MNPSADPFSQYRLNSKTIDQPQEVANHQNSAKEENPFAQFRLKEEESLPKSVFRNISRGALRTFEQVIGLPGDVQDMIQSGVLSGLETISGVPASEKSREQLKKNRAPTSKEFREFSKEASNGFTEPKSDSYVENKIDEYATTVGQLLGPIKFRKAIGLALGGELAKEGLNVLGSGQTTQEAAKLGTIFGLSLINPGGALKHAYELYSKANKLLPQGTTVSATNLQNKFTDLIVDLSKGVDTPTKTAVIKPVEQLMGKIKNGQINAEELIAAKRDINDLMKDPALLKGAKKLFLTVGKDLDASIEQLKPSLPEFVKAYRDANQAFGGVMQSQKVSNYIRKNLPVKPGTSVVLSLLGESALGHPELILPTLTGAAAAGGAVKSYELLHRIIKSPVLSKYYLNGIMAASKQNAPLMIRNFDKLENALK